MPVNEGQFFIGYNGMDAPFSNLYPIGFDAPVLTAEGHPVQHFNSVEQYFQYNKAVQAGDDQTASAILQTTDGQELRNLGRRHLRGYDDDAWKSVRDSVLIQGVRSKFSQNSDLANQLLSSGNKTLVEGNGYDRHYGSGIWTSQLNDQNFNNGDNVQGQALMQVRDELQRQVNRQTKAQQNQAGVSQISGDFTNMQTSGVIFQQVNALGLMGAGLARSLRDRYPKAYSEYRDLYDRTPGSDDDFMNTKYSRVGKALLGGRLQLVDVSDNNNQLYVANSFSQMDIGNDTTNKDWLFNNLRQANEFAKSHGLKLYVPSNVGSGLAGGNRQHRQEIQDFINSLGDNVVMVDFKSGQPIVDNSVQTSNNSKEEQTVPDQNMSQSRYGFSFEQNGYQNFGSDNIKNAGYSQPQISVNENTTPFTQKPYVVALTGHRPFAPRNGRYRGNGGVTSRNGDPYDMVMAGDNYNGVWRSTQDYFEQYIRQLVQDHGQVEIHSGLAMGADLIWARAALNVRHELGDDKVHLVADIPFEGQENMGYGRGEQGRANKMVYNRIKNMADAVVTYGDRNQSRWVGPLYEKRNQGMFMNADEGVEFAADEIYDIIDNNENAHSGTANGVKDIRNYGLKETRVDPRTLGFGYDSPIQSEPARDNQQGESRSSNRSQGRSANRRSSRQNTQREEYVFYPGQDNQPYVNTNEGQYRYPWRNSHITENSPVTVDELMTALQPAITRNNNRNNLRTLLNGEAMSESVEVQYPDDPDVNSDRTRVLRAKDPDGTVYNVSPSSVRTMQTVLRAAHDLGLDYDILQGRDDTIVMRLNDNSRAEITLLDPREPQRTGDVKLPDQTHWGVELGHLTYKDAQNNDVAIMMGSRRNGNRIENQSPIVMSNGQNHYGRFLNGDRRVNSWTPHGTSKRPYTDGDVMMSRARTMARYMGLDQATKDKLAVSSMINALGIDPTLLKPILGDTDFSKAKIETVDRLTYLTSGYQSQVNLGTDVPAEISPVHVSMVQKDQNGDNHVVDQKLSEQDLDGGKINLNLNSVTVASNTFQAQGRAVSVDPEKITDEQANDMVLEAYQRARVNYYSLLTGERQDGADEALAKDQNELRSILQNDRPVKILSGANGSAEAIKAGAMKPLTTEDQQSVLSHFQSGLLGAIIHDGRVDDDQLFSQRDLLAKSSSNPGVRARRLQAFDGLVDLFNNRFGTAPLMNGLDKDEMSNLTLDQYVRQLKHDGHNLDSDLLDQKVDQVNKLSHQMDALLIDKIGQDSFDSWSDDWNNMTFAQKRQVFAAANDNNQSVVKFDRLMKQMEHENPLQKQLNITQVIESSKTSSARAVDYEFKLAQALGQSEFKNNLVGNNDNDLSTVMERAVQFDPDSAMTIDQLREADKTGHEAELQQYIQDVKSGKKQFSFDPAENPEPGAFKSDGSGLINPVSENEFKARALELVKQRLVARGAKPDDIDLKIDRHGIIHFKTEIPLYRAATNSEANTGPAWKRNKDGSVALDENGRPAQVRAKDASDDVRTQPVEGSIGQVFAPSHDGLIRTNYQRFDGYDQDLNQQIFLPRMRGFYQLLNQDANGNYKMEDLAKESQNGLKQNNRLRIMTYQNIFDRVLKQNVDSLLATNNLGDLTHANSTTIMSKLMHGGVLGNKVPEALLNEKPSAARQAKLETQERAVRFDDNIANATKTSNVVSFGWNYIDQVKKMREQNADRINQINRILGRPNVTGEFANRLRNEQQALIKHQQDPKWPSQAEVQQVLQDPLSMYGGHSIGELAHEEDAFIFSDTLTGQGGTLGPLRYLSNNVEVNDDMSVTPNFFKDENGNPIRVSQDENGNWVKDPNGELLGYQSYTSLENLPFYENANMSAFDRESVGKEQGLKGHEMIENAHVANMSLSGFTTEDAMVVSKKFAEEHKFLDSTGKVRPLKIGDKISDQGGNKATVAIVVDPDMSPEDAEKAGISDVVSLFRDNPDLEVVMNGMSQLSRNNGATTYSMIHDKLTDENGNVIKNATQPMSFRPMRRGADGKYEAQEPVLTNATINKGRLIITDQTVDHKVTLYEGLGDQGRKSGALGMQAEIAKNAPLVANYFRNYGNGIRDWRRHLLVAGFDLNDAMQPQIADYLKLAKDEGLTVSEFKISPENQEILNQAYTLKDSRKGPKVPSSHDPLLSVGYDKDNHAGVYLDFTSAHTKAKGHDVNENPQFTGLDDKGELTESSKTVLDSMAQYLRRENRSKISQVDRADGSTYNASRDFLNQLPDGGLLKLPEGIKVYSEFDPYVTSNGPTKDTSKSLSQYLYILPLNMRQDTRKLNGMTMTSNYNRFYGELGEKLAKYQLIRNETMREPYGKLMANGDPKVQAKIDARIAEDLDIQGTVAKLQKEAYNTAFSLGSPKNSEFNTKVLAGRVSDSVTSQVSSNPGLPMDTIELAPAIAKKLGFVEGNDGFAHMKDHLDWQYLHVHRDPIWRAQGTLAFRVKINKDLENVRINPIMASLMDGDFDGDNLGLIAMKGDDVQKELREKCTVDQWMLDNNSVDNFNKAENMLNINAELVDMAVQTNQTYRIRGVDDKVYQIKPFDHTLDQNGNPVSLKQDSDLRNTLVGMMSVMRPDTLPSGALNKKGQFDPHAANAMLASDGMTDSDVLNMMVNHTIKYNYGKGRTGKGFVKEDAARNARLGVEDIVQTARGFNTYYNQKTQTIDFLPGEKSTLVNDGINYTNEETTKQSLNRYVREGAKGKPDKYDPETGKLIKEGSVTGLFKYMDNMKIPDLVKLGKSQVNADGSLNQENIKKYHAEMQKLRDQILQVQKATKEKTDITGIPGNIQKMITNALVNNRYRDLGVNAANGIGQAGTQKVLSIKRDPVGAGKAAELLQGPISDILDGRRPGNSAKDFPSFSLMGPEDRGRLGDDIMTVSQRVGELRSMPVYENAKDGRTLFDYKPNELVITPRIAESYAKRLGMKPAYLRYQGKDDPVSKQKFEEGKEAFLKDFTQALDEARTPLIPDRLLDHGRADEHSKGPDQPLTRKEFVQVMDYLYNDPERMDLGVNTEKFALLADSLVAEPNSKVVTGEDKPNEEIYKDVMDAVTDPVHADDEIVSCKKIADEKINTRDYSMNVGDAPLMSRIKTSGASAFEAEVRKHEDNPEGEREGILGKPGDWMYNNYTGNMSKEELAQMLSLKDVQSKVNDAVVDNKKPEAVNDKESVDDVIKSFHDSFQERVAATVAAAQDRQNKADDYDFDDGSSDMDDLNKSVADSVAASQASQQNNQADVGSTSSQAPSTSDAKPKETVMSKIQDQMDSDLDHDSQSDSSVNSHVDLSAESNDQNITTSYQRKRRSREAQENNTTTSMSQADVTKLKNEMSTGFYNANFKSEVAGQSRDLKSANQYMAYKYYEKAEKLGVKFNAKDKLPELLNNGDKQSLHDAFQVMIKETQSQLGDQVKLFEKQETKQFIVDGLNQQIAGNKQMQEVFNNQAQATATAGAQKRRNSGSDNEGSIGKTVDDGPDF